MNIKLCAVNEFTPISKLITRPACGTSRPNHPLDVGAMRHLVNKVTDHTNPVITIDHAQTAMLALLNGIRSSPTLPTPMPIGWKQNPAGGSYDNPYPDSEGYDATKWGLEYPNMTLDHEDFRQETSLKVQKAQEPYKQCDTNAVVAHGIEALKGEDPECPGEPVLMEEKECVGGTETSYMVLMCRGCSTASTLCKCDDPIYEKAYLKWDMDLTCSKEENKD